MAGLNKWHLKQDLVLLSTHANRHAGDISFTVCLFVRRNFGNGYLGRGLA